jgi:hypothetical protein
MEQSVLLLGDLRALAAAPAAATSTRTRIGRLALSSQSRMHQALEWETIALDGSILFLAAQFELAVRDMVEAFINAVARKFRRYPELPQEFRDNNLQLIGRLLQDARRAQLSHVDPNQVIQELSMCLRNGRPVRLFAVGFTLHERNMTSDQLSEILRRASVRNLWRQIALAAGVQSHLGVTNVGVVAELARRKLDGFMQQRNQIAHRGPNYQTVGDAIVLDYIAFFRDLVPTIADILEAKVASY